MFYLQEQKQELESVLKESEESQKQFLQRLFPDIQAATNNSHGEWLNQFEQEVIKFKETKQEIPTPVEKIVEIEKIVEKIVEVPAPAATEKIVEKIVEVPVEKIVEKIVEVPAPAATAVVDDEELKKLEGQVTHYKSVLAETVSDDTL